MTTTHLQLPELTSSQSQKHVTHNEALEHLDIVVQLAVLDKDLSTPPSSPSIGDRYIVGASATNDWISKEDEIAYYDGDGWVFKTPKNGWQARVVDENTPYEFNGTSWQLLQIAQSPNGAATEIRCIEEELTGLSGASVSTTIAFPNQCIVLGASVRVTTAITGATSFDIGDGSTVDRFGGSIGISSGSTNQGTVGPAGNYSSTTVTLTANGSDFTAGAVRVALHYMYLQPATG